MRFFIVCAFISCLSLAHTSDADCGEKYQNCVVLCPLYDAEGVPCQKNCEEKLSSCLMESNTNISDMSLATANFCKKWLILHALCKPVVK